MKLRQKLAMVLATAMVVTAVPVTTMAASTNSFSKTLSVADGTEITTGLHLIVDYSDTVDGDVFYLTAEDFDFKVDDENLYAGGVDVYNMLSVDAEGAAVVGKAELINGEVKVTVTAATDKLYIPVFGTVEEGKPSITVDARGSYASGSTLTFGEISSDVTLKATADDETKIAVDDQEAKLGHIIIEEVVAGTLDKMEIPALVAELKDLQEDLAEEQDKDSDDQDEDLIEEIEGDIEDLIDEIEDEAVIVVTLPNKSELEFAADQSDVVVDGSRGQYDEVDAEVIVKDEKTVFIAVTEASKSIGSMTIKGINVVPEDHKEDLEATEVEVTVEADNLDDTDLVVAEVQEYGVTLEVDEVEEIKTGIKEETVKVTLEELTEGSLEGKPVYFEIEGGMINNMSLKSDHDDKDAVLSYDRNDDGKIEEFVITPQDGETEYEMEIKFRVEAGSTDDVVITASGRGLEDDMEVKIGTPVEAFKVDSESFVLATAVKDQKGGKIVISENNKEELKNTFFIGADGLDIVDAEIEVTGGDVELTKESFVDADGNKVMKFGIDRQSDEASEITISDIEVSADGIILEGEYDVLIGGTGVSNMNSASDAEKYFEEAITLEGFFTTANAQEQAEVVLKVGDANYTVDGEAKTAETAPFIDPATNRTMAPVRAVAEAFGCELDFFFPEGSDQLVITLTKGDKHVQFQNGSNIMVVDGGQFIMSATAQIKDGYTFVPVAFLAQALAIDYTWDGATQTIVFGN